jgi:hypothetical protein
MMTIEEEIIHLVNFLSHSAGFSVDMNGQLGILPIYGTIEHWEIYWEGAEEGMNCQYQKIFFTLEEAATAFVEKRRYMCLGLDFNKMAEEGIKDE